MTTAPRLPILAMVTLALLIALAGGIVGAAAYARLLQDGTSPQRGTVIHFGGSFSQIETTPFCVEAQHFCLVQLESGEIRALYTYDTHAWSRERNCDVTWRPEMLFVDPDTQVQSQGWFRSGCSGATFRYNGERVFGPAPRDLDEFPVEEKTSVEEGVDGRPITVEYLEVDTRRLICGKVDNPTVTPGCKRAPLPE